MHQETGKLTTSLGGEQRSQQDEEDKKRLLWQLSHSPVDPHLDHSLERMTEQELKDRAEEYLNLDGSRLLWKLARRKYPACLGYVLKCLPREEARRSRTDLHLDGAIFEQPMETPRNVFDCVQVLDLFTNLYSLYLIEPYADHRLRRRLQQVTPIPIPAL